MIGVKTNIRYLVHSAFQLFYCQNHYMYFVSAFEINIVYMNKFIIIYYLNCGYFYSSQTRLMNQRNLKVASVGGELAAPAIYSGSLDCLIQVLLG